MKTFAILALFLAAFSACCQSNDDTVSLEAVHVEGNRFVNESGQTVVFRGLCLADPVKLVEEGQWSEEIFSKSEEWGANVVRFAVHPRNLNSFGWDAAFVAMDEGIEWAKRHGLYVIMDWHSIGSLKHGQFQDEMYRTTLDETLRFWTTVAERYKDEPAVALYELFNEPTCTIEGMTPVSWTDWKAILEQIIDAIRGINPDAVCLAAGFNWAYDLTAVAVEPIERAGVAYVSHPYPMKREEPWTGKWEADFGYVADTYPVICTEIGYCLEDEPGAHIPVTATDSYGEQITSYLDSKGISFTVWCFDTSWAPMLISDWAYTPTTQGRFFKNYLQSQR